MWVGISREQSVFFVIVGDIALFFNIYCCCMIVFLV
jgi:hypothetical protein